MTVLSNGNTILAGQGKSLSPATKKLLVQVKDGLYSESTVAKIWGVAQSRLGDQHPPTESPQRSYGRYEWEPCTDWTSGFFPGSVYTVLERSKKHPETVPEGIDPIKLQFAARWWASYMEPQKTRTDTHDLGFMIQPAFCREYGLFNTAEAKDVVITAAKSLATRFNRAIPAIKSWDRSVNNRYDLGDHNGDCLVIIDNLMNLDMLYWAAAETGDLSLSTIATTHAEKTLEDMIRHPEWSTYHLIQYDAETGKIRAKLTNQGYKDESCWSRGQAWSIYGFVDVYKWTKDPKFLDAAMNLADYFMSRMGDDAVPGWDFDAPDRDTVKDTSAAMAAAAGMIRIYKYNNDEKYLHNGLKLVDGSIKECFGEAAKLNSDGTVTFAGNDTILTHSTQNHNPDAHYPYFNHGLVYADYYFLEIGNLLLDMGLY